MYQQILVCIDGSEVSPLVLEHAIDVAGRNAAKIHVANVVDTRNWPSYENLTQTEEKLKETARAKAAEAVKHFIEQSGMPETQFNIIVEAGSPRSIITKKIAKDVQADLIIIGASSVRGLDHLVVGSVASAVLRTATCDVLVVRRP
ncbi:universal stress protein [Kurthia huakuii]|uniref:universal stress protein n=1 Tax=Kurthia huakuii TaxID=1421019 RepID=UPI000496BAF6|nr:universal stress protein [Kurthia huakuii]MBM7698737.1 nucleotide-binding universal stress UspA family protein [Kurthia huakuii]